MSESFLRRAYLIAVWLWLLFCLMVPVWTGKIRHYDERSERWHVGGAFGITGTGGSPFTSTAPLWQPPRSSGGLPATVRWPLAPIAATHNIEIQAAATFWRFTMGLLVSGVAVTVGRWTIRPRSSDRVLLVAGAVSIAILTANLVLLVLGGLSMGLALIDPVVIGVLGVGTVAGIIIGGFVVRPGIDKPSPPKTNIDSDATGTEASAGTALNIQNKTSTLSAIAPQS